MSSGPTRILIADLPSSWRSELVHALAQVEPAVRITESGQELRRALEEVIEPPRIIVVGPVLGGIGGLEALYLAEQTLVREKKPRPEWPARTVSFITEVRSDAELLDLIRRRGVNHFTYRDEPMGKTCFTLLASLRPASRAMVRMDATLCLREARAGCSVFDLSASGARLVVSDAALPTSPSVGETLTLRIALRSSWLELEAEVRRLAARAGFLGGRLIMGVQFVRLEHAAVRMLETMMRDAAEEFEMARRE